jgi:hypothetical protein
MHGGRIVATFLVIAALAGPDYKVEIEGEAVGPE